MSGMHALIVDDNANNMGVLGELLTLEGVQFTSLLDPKHLETTLQNISRLDVIFLDLEMPGIDGYEILQFLQEDDQLSTIPVVAYTVHVSEINTARQLGFHSFLGKPLDADKFPEQLACILSGEHVWSLP